MNVYLTKAQERRGALQARLEDYKAQVQHRALSEDEMSEGKAVAEELRALSAEIAEMEAEEARAAAASELTVSLRGGVESGLPSLRPTDEQIRAAARQLGDGVSQVRIKHENVEMRATIAASAVGGPVASGAGYVNAGVRRLDVALGLVPVRIDGMKWDGAKTTSDPTGTAATAEASQKPEWAAYADLSISLGCYARWSDFSTAAALANPMLLAQIAADHERSLAADLDKLVLGTLVTAAGAAADYNSGGESVADMVRNAMASVAATTQVEPDLIAVNPGDYAAVASFAATGADDVASWAMRVGPALVYPSNVITAGTVLVAAVRPGLVYVHNQRGVMTDMVQSLKDNVSTARTEIYAGAGVQLHGSAVLVDLSAS